MTEIISVRFQPGGKQYYFDPKGQTVNAGDGVILDTARGLEYAECVKGNHMVSDEAVVQPLRPLIRVATDQDKQIVAQNREREKTAFQICLKKIAVHRLDMKLVDAQVSFEGNKILFFFTSDGRVDFRALVRDLASTLHARIELRQIGVRDEAKMLGGLGVCGKPFCCAQFLNEFQPVSIKMAKTQNLSLNPTKISGTCGRLMCCLKYEQDAYEDAVKRCPKQESFVETPDGVGTVANVDLLREQVKVSLEDSNDPPKTYPVCEICVVRNGKGKRPEGYVAPPKEELAKLRRPAPLKPEAQDYGERSRLSAAIEEILASSEGKEKPAKANPSRGRGRSGSTPAQQSAEEKQEKTHPKQTHAPRQSQRAKQEAPQKVKQTDYPAKKSANYHRPRYRKPKPKSDGGAPKGE